MDPVARARALVRRVRRGGTPRPSTIVEILEACGDWDEVITVAEVLGRALLVSLNGDTVGVVISARRSGNDVRVTRVVARRVSGGIRVAVVSYYA